MHCPDDNEVAQFVAGLLTGQRRHELEVHFDRCPSCAMVVAEIGKMQRSANWLASGSLPGTPSGQSQRDMGAATPRKLGDHIGRYRLESLLGAGGMGWVYLALDPTLGRRVALKVIRPNPLEAPAAERESHARLLREAQVMATLAHPNVVPVYDAGEAGDGQVFLAMEYVPGETLASWVQRETRPFRDVLQAFGEAGQGLAAAHDAGILHRDFKPANVLCGADGRVRVTDFGLAQPGRSPGLAPPWGGHAGIPSAGQQQAWPSPGSAGGGWPSGVANDWLSRPGMVVGTPAYMSPEQMWGQPVTASSDQYSFCVALYEALFGVRPFVAESLEQLRWLVSRTRPARPKDHRGVPPAVSTVLLRGLEPDPRMRYPNLRELLQELSQAAARAGVVHVRAHIGCQLGLLLCKVVGVVLYLAFTPAVGEPAAAGPQTAGDGGIGLDTLLFIAAIMGTWFWLILGLLWAPLNAYGLWRRRPWSRLSTLVYALMGMVSCVAIPYALYALWSLRLATVRRELQS